MNLHIMNLHYERRVPKRLAALSADAALENGGRHAVEIAIEGIELVIRVDGAKHTMTPVRGCFQNCTLI